MGTASSLSFVARVDDKTRLKLSHRWQQQFDILHKSKCPTSASISSAIPSTVKKIWYNTIARLCGDNSNKSNMNGYHASGGGYIPYVDDKIWKSAIAYYTSFFYIQTINTTLSPNITDSSKVVDKNESISNIKFRLVYKKSLVRKFVAASCFHMQWCNGRIRREHERVLRHTAHAAFLVRYLASQADFWNGYGGTAFYYQLKKHCLGYVKEVAKWLEQEVYGGNDVTPERLLGLAHVQFTKQIEDSRNARIRQREKSMPKGRLESGTLGNKPRHTDVLPQIPVDKKTLLPFKNDCRFLIPLQMLALCVRPLVEQKLRKFCQVHKCTEFRLRPELTIDAMMRKLYTEFFDECVPRAASDMSIVKAFIHHVDAKEIKKLMIEANNFFGPIIHIDNEFETSTNMDNKYGIRAIQCTVEFTPSPVGQDTKPVLWRDILESQSSQKIIRDFENQHSTHAYHDKTQTISEADRQVQIWSPLGKKWLYSEKFLSTAAKFLVRLDFAPTAYIHAAEQLKFPIVMTTTNNIEDLCFKIQNNPF